MKGKKEILNEFSTAIDPIAKNKLFLEILIDIRNELFKISDSKLDSKLDITQVIKYTDLL